MLIRTKSHQVELDEHIMDIFWSSVIKTPVCWFWGGPKTIAGYGIFNVAEIPTALFSHRVSYFVSKGIPPNSKPEIDHLCKNRSCCNPDHLEAVSKKENLRRRWYNPSQISNNLDEYKKSLGVCDFNIGANSMLKHALQWRIFRLTWFKPDQHESFIKAIQYLDQHFQSGQINFDEIVDYHNFWFGFHRNYQDQTLDEELWARNKYRLNSGKRFIGIPNDEIVYARDTYRNVVMIYEDENWYDRSPYIPKYVKPKQNMVSQ